MPRPNSVLSTALVLVLPLALGGCPVAIVGGLAAAGGAGYVAAQERGVNGTVDDFTIKTNIETGWFQANPALQADLSVAVYQGRALLTGNAAAPQIKARAQQIASRTAGVTAVYDEIMVAPPEDSWAVAKDAWIAARLRSELVLDSQVRSVNYTIATADRAVYLIGSARTQAELDRATQIARYVPDVTRVVSYVEIRPGAPVAAEPMPPPASAQGPDNPVAAPPTAVEVHKL